MRSLALAALLGSFVAFSLVGQSLAEHGAAAAGATIGTAAGKPLGTAIGGVFGTVDKTAATAATPKTGKPVTDKSAAPKPSPVTTPAPAAAPRPASGAAAPESAPGGGGFAARAGGDAGTEGGAAGPSSGASRHHVARRLQPVAPPPQPVAAPIMPLVEQPVIREPTAQDVAKIRVGATASELSTALGVPESKVSIPDDNGHMLEICQYWAHGQPVATVRLDNGRVVSVKTAN